MRKLFIALLAVLFMTGIAFADAIPTGTDSKNVSSVWTQTVYNGSGDDISSGQAVRWDINASTNDLSMWIEEVDNVADNRTAGAIPYGIDCANGTICEIVVKGPVIMYHGTNTVTTATGSDGTVESDASGQPVNETVTGGVDEAILGHCVISTAGTAANTILSSQYSVIFVNPTSAQDD